MNLEAFSNAYRRLIHVQSVFNNTLKTLTEDGETVSFNNFVRFLKTMQRDEMHAHRDRASEFLEHHGPALVDVAPWAAAWTWLPVVEGKLVAAFEERGATVETRVSTLCTDPWDLHLESLDSADRQEHR